MAGVKISALPAADPIADADILPIVQDDSGLVTRQTTVRDVADYSLGLVGAIGGFRNAIINGNFDIWQRGTSFSNPAGLAYTSDRWLLNFNGTGATRTLSRQAFTLGQTDVPGEPTYFFRFNQSVAGSGGTFNVLTQRIEDVRTFAGQQVTLSFYAKAAASLTMPFVTLRQAFGTGGSPSAFVDTTLNTSVVVGTTFTKYMFTATLPSISGKTLGTDNNSYLEPILYLPLNTTFTFDLAQVQLEAGPVDTPFERRPIGTELVLCQRYYCETFGNARFSAVGNQNMETAIYWPVQMRASPTITSSGGTTVNVSQAQAASADRFGARFIITSSGSGDAYGLQVQVKASAEL